MHPDGTGYASPLEVFFSCFGFDVDVELGLIYLFAFVVFHECVFISAAHRIFYLCINSPEVPRIITLSPLYTEPYVDPPGLLYVVIFALAV